MKPITKKLSLMHLTWPIFIELFLFMIMGNIDTLMLSQYSDNAVAAVGVSNQVLGIIVVMFGFITTGAAILIAQYLGAREHKKTNEVIVISLLTNLVFGFILGIVLLLLTKPVLSAMGLPSELFGEASTFLKIVGSFTAVQSVLMTIGAVLRSHGYTKDMLFVTVTMNVLNIIGNFLVIFGPFGLPVLGVAGVAWSTTISRIVALAIGFYILFKRIGNPFKGLSLSHLPFYHLKSLLNLGVPAAGENLSYNASQIVVTSFIALIGTQALTTRVYALNIMMFIYLFSLAISQGQQIIIGHLVGAKKSDDAYHTCLKNLKIAIAVSFVTAIIFAFISEPLFRIFTDNEEIIKTGKILLFMTIILEPGRAFNLVIIGSLRAAGDVKFPVIVGIISMWGVSVSLSYFFGIILELGLVGVWIGMIADEWLRGLLMLQRWKSKAWVKKSLIVA
ncbi:MAG: MATE family efflux transporter [Bacillaceae bacterium]